MGLDENSMAPSKFPGGETEGRKRLRLYMAKKQWVCQFEKPNRHPWLMYGIITVVLGSMLYRIEPSTTVLSPYISHGCLSAKLFYHKLKEVEHGMKHTFPPVFLMGQLMWREFYYTAGTGTENFDKMVGNYALKYPGGKMMSISKNGQKGESGRYPFVDAIMRQLRQEGWIHHLAGHMVACFLTRGDLWISWKEGVKVL